MCTHPPGSSCVKVAEVFASTGSVAVLPCTVSSQTKHSTAVTWKRITDGYESSIPACIRMIHYTYNHKILYWRYTGIKLLDYVHKKKKNHKDILCLITHFLSCSFSEERTVWRRDKSGLEFKPVGQAPQAHCPYSNFRSTDYSLHIKGTREEDAGLYRCEVEGQRSKTVMLHVVRCNYLQQA